MPMAQERAESETRSMSQQAPSASLPKKTVLLEGLDSPKLAAAEPPFHLDSQQKNVPRT